MVRTPPVPLTYGCHTPGRRGRTQTVLGGGRDWRKTSTLGESINGGVVLYKASNQIGDHQRPVWGRAGSAGGQEPRERPMRRGNLRRKLSGGKYGNRHHTRGSIWRFKKKDVPIFLFYKPEMKISKKSQREWIYPNRKIGNCKVRKDSARLNKNRNGKK